MSAPCIHTGAILVPVLSDRIEINTSNSKTMVFKWKRDKLLPQVDEFKYFGVLFTSKEKVTYETDRWFDAASAMMLCVEVTGVQKSEAVILHASLHYCPA